MSWAEGVSPIGPAQRSKQPYMGGVGTPNTQRSLPLTALLLAAAGEEVDQLAALPVTLRGEVVWRAAGSTLCALRLLRCLPLEVRHAECAAAKQIHSKSCTMPLPSKLFCRLCNSILLLACTAGGAALGSPGGAGEADCRARPFRPAGLQRWLHLRAAVRWGMS